MKLQTTLAAAPAVALLALVACAETPIPTAADPAEPGAEGSALPSGLGGGLAMASQSECQIMSVGPVNLIGPKEGRPDSILSPRPTVAVAEIDIGTSAVPNVFWAQGTCPAATLHLEIDSVLGPGDSVPEPGGGDFRMWKGTGYQGDDENPYWLMTYSSFVKDERESHRVWLALVRYYDGVRHVLSSRTDQAVASREVEQSCWVWVRVCTGPLCNVGPSLLDSEDCKVPLTLDPVVNPLGHDR